MLSKVQKPQEANEPPKKRFRSEMAGLFLRNQIAARKAASVSHAALTAKGQGVEDLAALGSNPAKPARHRDVLRKLLKNKHWPEIYYLDCPVMDLRTQEEIIALVPLWLPHELVKCLDQKKTSLRPCVTLLLCPRENCSI